VTGARPRRRILFAMLVLLEFFREIGVAMAKITLETLEAI